MIGSYLCEKDILGWNIHNRTKWKHEAFFDKYVHYKKILKQFVEQYQNALENKCEKESRAAYESFHSTILCVYDYDIEK